MPKPEVVFAHSSTPNGLSQCIREYMKEGYRIVPNTNFCAYENIAMSGGSIRYDKKATEGIFACEMALDHFDISSSR